MQKRRLQDQNLDISDGSASPCSSDWLSLSPHLQEDNSGMITVHTHIRIALKITLTATRHILTVTRLILTVTRLILTVTRLILTVPKHTLTAQRLILTAQRPVTRSTHHSTFWTSNG